MSTPLEQFRALMIYPLLFFGLPLLGIGAFLLVRRQMLAANTQAPSVRAVFLVFAAYGALLLIAVAAAFDTWSGMHSIGFGALAVAAAPMLLWQGIRLLLHGRAHPAERTGLHRNVAVLSAAFPLVFALFVFTILRLNR